MDTTYPAKDVTSEDLSSDRIKSDIGRTRAEMDQTLNELGERLQPRNLISDVVDYFRSRPTPGNHSLTQDAQRAGRAILQQVRLHPVPSLLLTGGIVWLIAERAQAKHPAPYPASTRFDDDQPDVPNTGYSPKTDFEPAAYAPVEIHREETEPASGTLMHGLKEAGAKASETIGKAADSVKTAAGTVRETIGSAAHATAQAGHRLKEQTGAAVAKIGSQLQQGYQAGRDRYRHGVENYPLAMGAGCLALGTLIGFILPRSRTEDEWLGPSADRVKDQTKAIGAEVVRQTKEIAKGAADSAMHEARSQGLHPTALADKVSHVVSSGVDAIKSKTQPVEGNPPPAEQNSGSPAPASTPSGTSSAAVPPRRDIPGCDCGS